MINQIVNIHDALKEITPIIHMIHNFISANECADGAIAIGASPIFTASIQEVEQIAYRSNALSINTGTINDGQIKSIILAGTMANEANIPIVIDPVGVSFSKYRAQSVLKILQQIQPAIIKGNYSEIAFLSGENVSSRGFDSFEAEEYSCFNAALKLADKYNCTVIITGKTDIIASSTDVIKIYNGSHLLQKFFSSGDLLGVIAAAYCGITRNFLAAATAATGIMGIAGELAEESISGQDKFGSFKTKFFDEISKMNSETIKNRIQILSY